MYSFGVTLYEMVTGRRPFYGASEDESDLAIVAEIRNSPPPPSDYATCPPKLETLILDLLEKNPKNRPSADRVIQELQSIRASMRSETAPFIDKARLSEGLQYPTTIVPGFLGAVASLQLMHGMPSWYFEALVAAATALGVVAIGSFAWRYFVRHSQQYAEELERRIALLERPS
jgi:serine/threonine protein kinase